MPQAQGLVYASPKSHPKIAELTTIPKETRQVHLRTAGPLGFERYPAAEARVPGPTEAIKSREPGSAPQSTQDRPNHEQTPATRAKDVCKIGGDLVVFEDVAIGFFSLVRAL